MNEPQQQSNQAKNQPPAPDKAKSIAVRVIYFDPVRPVDVPGKAIATSVTASEQRNVNRWEITYHPHMRHHEVVWFSTDGRIERRFIPEANVSGWEPA